MAQNGFNNSNGVYNNGMNGGPILPSGGQTSDLATLMQNMESLSGYLQQNREEWASVQDGIARVELLNSRRSNGSHDNALLNGDSAEADPHQPSVAQLQNELSRTRTRLDALETADQRHREIQAMYEEHLTESMDRIRTYTYESQNHVIALHQHYTTLLQQSRNETVEAQLTHQAWQAGLQKVSEGVRLALRSSEDGEGVWKRRVAALREENRVLRAKAGWEAMEMGSSSEEDEDDGMRQGVGGMRMVRRGRGSASGGAGQMLSAAGDQT